MSRTRSLLILLLLAPLAAAQQVECTRGLEFPERLLSFSNEAAYHGDLDEDGRWDAVLVNGTISETTILLNRGGVYRESLSFRDDFYLDDVYDHNGDGHLDLLQRTGTRMRVRFGNGDGTFAAPIDSQIVGGLHKRWRRDFDGDGLLDVVGLTNPSDRIHFVRARRDGSFALAATTTLATLTWNAGLGDFDGDGHLDLFDVHYSHELQEYRVRTLWGAANGQFTSAEERWPLRAPPVSLGEFGAADFDENGSDEAYYVQDGVLVIVHADERKLRVEQITDPSLTHIEEAGGLVRGFADLDADGRKDLILGRGTIFFFSRKEDGTFSPAELIDTGSRPSVAFIDYNHDGITDLVTKDGRNGVTVLLGGSGFPSARIYAAPSQLGLSATITPADMNRDGIEDLVVNRGYASSGNDITIFQGDGRGAFRASWHRPFSGTDIVVTDLDGDQIPDLVSAEQDSSINISFGTPAGFDEPAAPVTTGRLVGSGRTKNRNAAAVLAGKTVYFLTSSGAHGTLEEAFELPGSGSEHPTVTVIEADGDDESEFLVSTSSTGTRVFNRGGAGWVPGLRLDVPFDPSHAASADLDGDGRLDFALWGDSLRFLIADPDGSYRRVTLVDEPIGSLWSGHERSAALKDFDNDGRIDIFFATSDMYTVWRNAGGGLFEPYLSSEVGGAHAGGILLDTDRDGWKDVVALTPQGVQVVRSVCARERLRVTASPRSTPEGGSVELLVHALVTNLGSAVITIREGSRVVHQHQPTPSERSTTVWSTGPLALGTHVYHVELRDHFGPPAVKSITIQVRPPASRRRGVRH